MLKLLDIMEMSNREIWWRSYKYYVCLQVAELRLDLHAAAISELSIASSKELAIEEALTKIKDVWVTLELDIVAYREIPKVQIGRVLITTQGNFEI